VAIPDNGSKVSMLFLGRNKDSGGSRLYRIPFLLLLLGLYRFLISNDNNVRFEDSLEAKDITKSFDGLIHKGTSNLVPSMPL